MKVSFMRHVAPALRQAFFSLIFVVLAGCSSQQNLPPIRNASQLVNDCAALQKEPIGTLIPKGKWPASVAALYPVSVSREDAGIQIVIYAKTGEGCDGYLISQSSPAPEKHLMFYKTDYPNIYQFDFKP